MSPTRIATAALFLVIFSGCQAKGFLNRPAVTSNVGATFHNKDLVLQDIPLPRNFILKDGSFCFGTQHFRYGEFLLEGSDPVEDIFDFYKKRMSNEVWKELDAQNLETVARLKYENKWELCSILCQEKDLKTEVRIIIEQKKS